MQIKALGNVYPFPSKPLELGEQRLLKREFGVVPSEDFDLSDPDHLAAFLYAAMRESDSQVSAKSILASINRVRTIEILNDDGSVLGDETEDDDESEADPTPRRTGKRRPKAEDDTDAEAGS